MAGVQSASSSALVIDRGDGTHVPVAGSEPAAWRAVGINVIAKEDEYQILFASGDAQRGGYIVNTSAPGSEPLWIDPTGALGKARSNGAMPVYPASDFNTAPGGWRIPATAGAVTIMGMAGATFQAFYG